MQTFPVPANHTIEWTEYIMAMEDADAVTMQAGPYDEALDAVTRWINGEATGMPVDEVHRMDSLLKDVSSRTLAASSILSPGTPWGALEELRQGRPLSSATPFAYPGWKEAPEARLWVELVENGEFSEETLARSLAPSFQISPEWTELVSRSKDTWLRSLLLGISETEHAGGQAQQEPDFGPAIAHFARSLALKNNPVAARCLAVTAPTRAMAAGNFSLAWQLALAGGKELGAGRQQLLTALAGEVCSFYLEQLPTDQATQGALVQFIRDLEQRADVPEAVRRSDNVLFAKATVAQLQGDCATARAVIQSSRFPTYFSGPRTQLASIWTTCAAMDEEARLGRPLTAVERHRVRSSSAGRAPANIGPFPGKILPH